MRQIIFTAGLHWHPDCRHEYQNMLRQLVRSDGKPAFIAVEWDSGVVKARVIQRRLYRKHWLAKRPQDKGRPIRQLTTRLAWESDGHRGIVRSVPIVWLEECRPDKPSLGSFGSNKLFNEQLALGINFTAVSSKDALAEISRGWIAEANQVQSGIQAPRNSFRDVAWYKRISRAIRIHSGDWALV
ncbi:MAG TPA: hypothetical protein VGR71_06105, partial [Nitrospira sp.]|nr:hypothetical protein [Nitrospira sp.]